MRVLLVTAHFRPHIGGIERFVETLAEGLVGRGHEVTVLCCRTERAAPPIEDGPYRVIRIPSSTLPQRLLGVPYPLPSPRWLRRVLRAEVRRADVVHVQDALYPTSVAAILAARKRSVPSLLTQHVGFVPQGRRTLDVVQRVALATVGRVARAASRTVTLNRDVARFARGAWGLSNVDVLPVGVPPGRAGRREEERRRLGIDESRFVVLFVGRDVPKKGLDLALDACDGSFDLVVVSDRPATARPGVTMLPFVPRERLADLYAAADAFLLPSVGEGIPVVLQEAATAGLPLVVTPNAGYDDVLRAGDYEAIPRDSTAIRLALLELASDPTRRSRLGARACAAAHRSFSFERCLDGYEQAYRELVSASGATPRSRDCTST